MGGTLTRLMAPFDCSTEKYNPAFPRPVSQQSIRKPSQPSQQKNAGLTLLSLSLSLPPLVSCPLRASLRTREIRRMAIAKIVTIAPTSHLASLFPRTA